MLYDICSRGCTIYLLVLTRPDSGLVDLNALHLESIQSFMFFLNIMKYSLVSCTYYLVNLTL